MGEIRCGEAFDLVQAMNTGYSGTISTIHANSSSTGIATFPGGNWWQSCIELPYRAIESHIAGSIQILVHSERAHGRHFIAQALQIQGYAAKKDKYEVIIL